MSLLLLLGNTKGKCGSNKSHRCSVGCGEPLCCSFVVLLPFSQSSGLQGSCQPIADRQNPEGKSKKGRILKANLIFFLFLYKMHILAALAAVSLQSMADENCCTGSYSLCLFAGYLAVRAFCCCCSFRINQRWTLLCLHPKPHRV